MIPVPDLPELVHTSVMQMEGVFYSKWEMCSVQVVCARVRVRAHGKISIKQMGCVCHSKWCSW